MADKKQRRLAKLTEDQRQEITGYLQSGQDIPDDYKHLLFPPERQEYELVYAGKEREEDIIANTWGVPLQPVKTFNLSKKGPRPEWTNRLIFGDNLQVMKRLLDDGDVKGEVQLVYIDPPFATKQDFQGSQDQKAYQDRVAGAQFIEYIRKRLILLRELLAPHGAIVVHLDNRKSHYIKAILDEVFREHNFRSEIIWYYRKYQMRAMRIFANNSERLLWYVKSAQSKYTYNPQTTPLDEPKYLKRKQWDKDLARIVNVRDENGELVYDKYEDEKVDDVWDIPFMGATSPERTGYPTQKPEKVLARVISACSNRDDLVLDVFAGSGTTLAVAEKLGRRWIGVDCGKLAIYTMQKRLLTLRKGIGQSGKQHHKPKPFTLYNGGLYDFKRMSELPWDDYRLFALQLFQVRDKKHTLAGIGLDGFKNDADVLVFNFKQDGDIVVDEGYVEELHRHFGGRTREEFYIIAPASRVTFLEDYLDHGSTRYYILRIPYSIIDELHDRPFEQIRQPADEAEINNTVEAVGFDFIIPPTVKARYSAEKPKGQMFDAPTITIEKFSSEVMMKKARKFTNRETLSMVMVDYDYKGNGEDVFYLDAVFYRDSIQKDDWKVRLDAGQFGERIMIIYMDIFGNEMREVKTPSDFGIKPYGKTKRVTNKAKKPTTRKNTAKKITGARSLRKTTKSTARKGK